MIEQTPNAPPAEATVQKTVEDCQRYRDKLYWRCRLYFRDWPDYAEDCVQEAYIELMQALRAGRCIHNYEAWLFKVAILKGKNKKIICIQEKYAINSSFCQHFVGKVLRLMNTYPL